MLSTWPHTQTRQVLDNIESFDRELPPDKPDAVIRFSRESLAKAATTLYEARIASTLQLSGLQKKKNLAKFTSMWSDDMGEARVPASSDLVFPALIAVVKGSEPSTAPEKRKASFST